MHHLPQVLAREGQRAFLVRVVAAPHHPVDPDAAERRPDVGRSRLAHPDVAVLAEVLRRAPGWDGLALEPHLPRAAAAQRDHQVVELLEHPGDPGAAGFGEDELQVGEPLEHAAGDQVHERALGVEDHLRDVHDRHGGRALVRGTAGPECAFTGTPSSAHAAQSGS